MEALKGSKGGKIIGTFTKDKFPGDFMEGWRKAFPQGGFETVSFVVGICHV